MRLVQATDQGVVELTFMWMPVFIGMNSKFLQEMEGELAGVLGAKLKGQKLTEELLDEAHDLVLDYIQNKYTNITGLRDYLDAIKYVDIEP